MLWSPNQRDGLAAAQQRSNNGITNSKAGGAGRQQQHELGCLALSPSFAGLAHTRSCKYCLAAACLPHSAWGLFFGLSLAGCLPLL